MPSKYTYICLVIGFISLVVTGQQKEQVSIIDYAYKLVYENPDKAIEVALAFYNDPETTVNYKVNALLCISTAYTSKRDYEKSLEYIIAGTKYFADIKDEKIKINMLNKIAGQYQNLKIYDKAIEYLDESLIIIEKYPRQDSIQVFLGYNYILRGFIYREQMSCEIALKFFDKAIEAYDKTLVDNPIMNTNVSVAYYNKGNCHLILDKIEAAETSFTLSMAHAERIGTPSLIAFAQKGLAEVKTRQGYYDEAITILKIALNSAENVGDLILNRGLYDGLSNSYLAINDWENYAVTRAKFLELQQETKNSERNSINQSLLNITQERAKEIEQFQRVYDPIQYGLIGLIIVACFLLIRFVYLSEKRLKSLEKQLKS